MKEENNRKEKKFLLALKFSAEKIMPKNWKRNQSSHISLLSLFFPCSTVYNHHIFSAFHCLKKYDEMT